MSLIRRRLSVGAAVLVAMSGLNATAFAATCYDANQQLPASQVSNFTGNPASLLSGAPNGGGALISQVRDLAATDSATLPLILGLLNGANDDQKKAIGSGLAQAARVCVPKDQAYANNIQQAIADTKDPVLVLAYATSAGNDPSGIGAGGSGAGASPGGVGGATTTAGGPAGGGGTVEGINGNGVNTGNFTYSASVASASNPNTSVSP
ncbi:hypothetical protein [Bradyrhizobium sp. Gha]|uniref:hypothetical protein n=1 Tax=Bradyrhizobium sp. Gha TaxID=1855318 RepID=UPI0008E7213F|nr:hypothetical protein [Bradyrhizobium sp. Gha]SFI08822.1 hypothetical protein SAMN05216525_10438 [Bradyrhizobium sp. Gha]